MLYTETTHLQLLPRPLSMSSRTSTFVSLPAVGADTETIGQCITVCVEMFVIQKFRELPAKQKFHLLFLRMLAPFPSEPPGRLPHALLLYVLETCTIGNVCEINVHECDVIREIACTLRSPHLHAHAIPHKRGTI